MSQTIVEKSSFDQKSEIKDVLKDSQDMVGEKTASEGIFQKIFRGYIPLDLLSGLRLELQGEEKTKIDAYCQLIQIAFRRNMSTLDYLVKGYGTTHEDIKFKQTAFLEYEEERNKIQENEKKAKNLLDAPYSSLKNWITELKITPVELSTAIVNPLASTSFTL